MKPEYISVAPFTETPSSKNTMNDNTPKPLRPGFIAAKVCTWPCVVPATFCLLVPCCYDGCCNHDTIGFHMALYDEWFFTKVGFREGDDTNCAEMWKEICNAD